MEAETAFTFWRRCPELDKFPVKGSKWRYLGQTELGAWGEADTFLSVCERHRQPCMGF